MKKIVIALLLAALTVAMCACGNTSKTEEKEEASAANESSTEATTDGNDEDDADDEEVTSGQVGDVSWTVENGVLTISGAGDMSVLATEEDCMPWQTLGYGVPNHESSFQKIIIEEGITTIPYWAFKWCNEVTEIEIPDSITEIGDYAFMNCSVTELTIPAGVTQISMHAFDEGSISDIYYGGSESDWNAICECASELEGHGITVHFS